MPSRSSRSSPTSLTSFSEPTGSASLTAMHAPPSSGQERVELYPLGVRWTAVSTDRFGYDRFLVEQLFRPVVNLYRVTPLAAGDTPAGGPVAYVRQKRMKIKEDIRFYADEEETQEVFAIKARSILDTG